MLEIILSYSWIPWCCGLGLAMLFTEPISERKRRREAKPAPKGKSKKRTARKNRAVQKPKKQKKEKPKGWFVPPPLSPLQEEIFTRYRVGRDFTFQN